MCDLPPPLLDLYRCQLASIHHLFCQGHFRSTCPNVAHMCMQQIHALQQARWLQHQGSGTHPTMSPTPRALETGSCMELPELGSSTSVIVMDRVAYTAPGTGALAETTGPDGERDRHVLLG